VGEIISDLDTLLTNSYDLNRLARALNAQMTSAGKLSIRPVQGKLYSERTLLWPRTHISKRRYDITLKPAGVLSAFVGLDVETKVGSITIDAYADNPDDVYSGVREDLVMKVTRPINLRTVQLPPLQIFLYTPPPADRKPRMDYVGKWLGMPEDLSALLPDDAFYRKRGEETPRPQARSATSP
jgi:hypothetical protein